MRRTRHQMYQHINADYYGFRDEEDGVLEKVEAEAERRVRQKVRVECNTFSVVYAVEPIKVAAYCAAVALMLLICVRDTIAYLCIRLATSYYGCGPTYSPSRNRNDQYDMLVAWC